MAVENATRKMTPAYETVALLVARGLRNAQISDVTGYHPNYVWRIKTETEGFDALVAEFKREIQDNMIDEAADISRVFNDEVVGMAENLKSLAYTAQKEGIRLNATKDWLDRAPDAPKRIQRNETSEEHKIIFGLTQVENMKAALVDVGESETVELLEGIDYEEQSVEKGNVVNADE